MLLDRGFVGRGVAWVAEAARGLPDGALVVEGHSDISDKSVELR